MGTVRALHYCQGSRLHKSLSSKLTNSAVKYPVRKALPCFQWFQNLCFETLIMHISPRLSEAFFCPQLQWKKKIIHMDNSRFIYMGQQFCCRGFSRSGTAINSHHYPSFPLQKGIYSTDNRKKWNITTVYHPICRMISLPIILAMAYHRTASSAVFFHISFCRFRRKGKNTFLSQGRKSVKFSQKCFHTSPLLLGGSYEHTADMRETKRFTFYRRKIQTGISIADSLCGRVFPLFFLSQPRPFLFKKLQRLLRLSD